MSEIVSIHPVLEFEYLEGKTPADEFKKGIRLLIEKENENAKE